MGKERGKPTTTPIEAQITKTHGAEAPAVSIHPTRTTRFASYSARVFKKTCVSPLTLRKNESGMQRKILGYVILFLFCISIALVMTPSVVEAANFSTNAYIWVEPSIVGVGQKVEISMSVYPFPPTGNVFHNYRVIITKPDGANETLGPFSSDTTGFAATQYVAQQVGTFHAQFFFQREVFNGGDSYNASISSSATFTVQQNPVSMHLTTAISGSGSTNPVPGVYSYNPGDNVSVTALPAPGWIFSYWGDESDSNPYNLTMFADKYLKAYFTQIQYSLNNTVTGSGTTNISSGIHQYASGTVVNVNATPNSGWMLSSWILNGVNAGSVNPYRLKMDSNNSLTAVFTPIPYTLNMTAIGSGTTIPVSGIHQYTPGTYASVNATPSSGWRFGYWMLNGVNVSSATQYSVLMSSNKTLTAVFSQIPYTLNISVTGSGTTNPTPAVRQYLSGTTISVSAIPSSDWTLSSWMLNGVNQGINNPYTVTMNANKTLTAVFTQQLAYTLSTAVSGSGSINPTPGSHQYAAGTTVSVSATPASGSTFSYWLLNGVNVGTISTYTVSMNADNTLTAVFKQQPPSTAQLTISVQGSGNTNPAAGSHTYDLGSTLQVAAQPNANWSFNCWLLNNNNVSQALTYSVTMNGDQSLAAVFQQNNLPTAVIETIEPNSPTVGQEVTFKGHGNDTDGDIIGYRWTSNNTGLLSTLPSFSISNLSVGTHTISFEVQDNNGGWSTKSEQAITIEESTPLSLVAISVAAVAGSISLTGGLILFRGKLSNFFRSKLRFKKNTDTENQKEKEEKEKKKKQKEKSSLELNAALPPRIMESKPYDAQINVKNTGNSNVKDILIRAHATPGISMSRNERKIRSLKAGKNCNQVFQFQSEKNIDRGNYVLRFDMKSQVTPEQTKSSFTRAVKIGFLSNQTNTGQEVYERWLSKHSYVWDELHDADDLCNCLLNYNLLILSPEVEVKKQWENNIVKFIKSGQSLLIHSSNMLPRPESLPNVLGYSDMSYEVANSSQLPIRVLNQHPIVSEFNPGEQLTLNNCTGDVCVSKNSTGTVVAEFPSVNGKPHVPAIIAKEEKGKVVYFNFHAPLQFDTLLKNTIEWLLETTESPQR